MLQLSRDRIQTTMHWFASIFMDEMNIFNDIQWKVRDMGGKGDLDSMLPIPYHAMLPFPSHKAVQNGTERECIPSASMLCSRSYAETFCKYRQKNPLESFQLLIPDLTQTCGRARCFVNLTSPSLNLNLRKTIVHRTKKPLRTRNSFCHIGVEFTRATSDKSLFIEVGYNFSAHVIVSLYPGTGFLTHELA